MTDAPELKPCPFCKGAETYIAGQGQVWRGVSGYSDPQYFTLTHHGSLSDADDFPRCSIQFRARTYDEAVESWNTRTDHAQDLVAAAYEAAANLTDELARAEEEVNNPHDSELFFYASKRTRALTPADAVAALEAAKAEAYAAGQKALKIKPLEWVDFEGQGAKANAFYQANYLITRWRGADEFEVALSYPGYQTGYDGERFHKTLEAAKAAAQADYERRILSALEAGHE